MDNGLTLSDVKNIDKFTKIANDIAKRNANITNLQESLKRFKKLQRVQYDIRADEYSTVFGCIPTELREDIKAKFAEQINPIVTNIINQTILNEISEIKKLIGE